ncbi:uncharacterized protein KY384_007695 [Bacidia gigantensis]|uniref:uncharacterized protein n=1 Tax=Bacidia gigantensis TaxID=2732470 RepID=UPI001D047B4D|nr:uncharacterized protein KY384_007695 [Bacidia gigantensis]KAG8527543.1 hypothetical protein KY384_007695 [Bacidia gigantensis]
MGGKETTTSDTLIPPVSSGAQGNQPSSPPQRYTIDDCINDMKHRHTLTLPDINDAEGDTWVFIDPPSRQPEQTEADLERYAIHLAKPFLMKSEKLIHASPMFKEMLGSTRQFRTIRRRGLVNKLPNFVKFVLDLTPPAEGEDAVYLTASLCCSEGIRFWYQASEIWNVSDSMVGGKDEYSATRAIESPSSGSPLEYSPIRHRSAIERVLAAIQGVNYHLDSAVKVWTTIIVADYFGITSRTCTDLTDSIVTWLRAEPNSHFIEVNPEATLRIATAIQNEDLARDAFAILVGEEALDSIARRHERQHTTFGRRKDELPEMWLQPIEYASKSLVERTAHDFEKLRLQENSVWFDDLPSIKRLNNFADPELQRLAIELKDRLKERVTMQIDDGLTAPLTAAETGFVPRKGVHILPRQTSLKVVSGLRHQERILSRDFWNRLRDETRITSTGYVTPYRPYLQGAGANERAASDAESRRMLMSMVKVIVRNGQDHLEYLHRLHSFVQGDGATTTSGSDERNADDDKDMMDEMVELYPLLGNDLPNRDTKPNFRGIEEAERPSHLEVPWIKTLEYGSHPLESPVAISNLKIQTPAWDIDERKDLKDLNGEFRSPTFFDLETFAFEVSLHLISVAEGKLALADITTRRFPYLPELIGTLTSLSDSEWRYLPMWAGGFDDGTGAVFSDDPTEAIPDAAFSTPGPSVHTGDSTYSASSFGDFDILSEAGSSKSFNTSTAVGDGHTDQLFRHKTYAVSSMSSGTDNNSIVDIAEEDEETKAIREVKAMEAMEALEAESRETEHRQHAETTREISYDDMFFCEGDDQELEDDSDSDTTERGDDFDDLGDYSNTFDLALRTMKT